MSSVPINRLNGKVAVVTASTDGCVQKYVCVILSFSFLSSIAYSKFLYTLLLLLLYYYGNIVRISVELVLQLPKDYYKKGQKSW